MSIPITLRMDDNWTIFEGVTGTMDNFIEKFMPNLYLKQEVHADVIENFRIIRRLIECSFFECKFYDVAVLKSVLTMEMALKLRYKELQGKHWDSKGSLRQLIKWFEERNHFEAYYPEYMDSMRKIRNLLAHPYEHTFGGASVAPLIERIVDIVNGLYEDPDLRVARKNLTLSIIQSIKSFGNRMICKEEDRSYFVYRAWPGFINNKSDSLEIHFYYKPTCTFKDEYLENNQWIWAPISYFKACQINIQSNQLTLENSDKEELILRRITDPIDNNSFEQWAKKYRDISDQTGEFINKKNSFIDPFFIHLREFHKME